jgi:hypothetical protein
MPAIVAIARRRVEAPIGPADQPKDWAATRARLIDDNPGMEPNLLVPAGSRIVHIGPHKTGTSGLQAALDIARRDLERQGVHYASYGRHSMLSVLAALDLPSPWANQRKAPPRWRWELLLRNVRGSSADRVILSSEFFSEASPVSASRVVQELDPARVHILVTLRPIAKIIPSQWQQWVQNQTTTPLDAWVDDLLAHAHDAQPGVFWRRHRHDQLIQRWADIVGPGRVTAVVVDDRDHATLLRVVERLTGLRMGTLAVPEELINRSMTVPEIEVIRAFNVAFKAQNLPKPLYSRVMRFGAASLMEARQPGADEPRIELAESATAPIEALAKEIVAGIRSTGVRVVGDLEALTVVPRGRTGSIEPVSVSPTVAASVAISVLTATGLARGTSPLPSGAVGEAEDDAAPPIRAPRPVNEPVELLRLSTLQLFVTIVRRSRVALIDRVMRPFRRGP